MNLELIHSTILAAIIVTYIVLVIISIYGKRYYFAVFCAAMIAYNLLVNPPSRKVSEGYELETVCQNGLGLLLMMLLALFLWSVIHKEKKSFENAGK